jgi:O-acetyl-ADP-ribose deacetylase (regulator of RNase III)
MPTTLRKGDLFDTPDLKAFAHACNCAGTMDAGISVAFKKRWPRMFEDYAQRCRDKRLALGDLFVWNEGDVVVYNLAIQQNWRARSKMSALTRSVRRMIELAQQAGVERIALPRIGAGLGGLDWKRVRSFLAEEGEKTPVELVVFEQFVRARPAASPED